MDSFDSIQAACDKVADKLLKGVVKNCKCQTRWDRARMNCEQYVGDTDSDALKRYSKCMNEGLSDLRKCLKE